MDRERVRWLGRLIGAIGLFVIVGAAARGRAQERAAEAVSPDEEARRVFAQGRDAYAAGDYEAALNAFRDAYALSHRPELQFNIGQAADRLRRDREARDAFEAYLAAVPFAANRVEVEARLRVLREEIARDEALRTQAMQRVSASSDPPIVEQWWFWTLIGVAVVGAGVGIGFAVGSREELAAPTVGVVGPGGVVIALEGP
ncbi:MAG: hypothetical protein OHK0013_19950 [Sandaracinaceae bacterium]